MSNKPTDLTRLLDVERTPNTRRNGRDRLGRAIARAAVRAQYSIDLRGTDHPRTRVLLDEFQDAVTDYFAAGCVTRKDIFDVE